MSFLLKILIKVISSRCDSFIYIRKGELCWKLIWTEKTAFVQFLGISSSSDKEIEETDICMHVWVCVLACVTVEHKERGDRSF